MTRISKLFSTTVTALVFCASQALAVPIDDVVSGARYSVSGLGSNREAVAVKVDRSDNTVLVRYDDDGRTAWVNADRLLASYSDSFSDDFDETIGWGVAGLILLCALDENCRDNAQQPSQAQTAGVTPPSQGNWLALKNDCHSDVSFKLAYMKPDRTWYTGLDAWTFESGKYSYLLLNSKKIIVEGDNVFIYAQSTDGRSSWTGAGIVDEADRWRHPQTGNWYMRAASFIDSDGDRTVKLSCE